MANPDAVSQLYLDSFGNVKVASATSVNLAATGNAVVTLPLVRGGLTNGGAVSNSGGVIIRKITVTSPAGDVSTANLAISLGSSGNAGNLITANTVLTTLSAAGRYQDIAISGAYGANTYVSGSTTSALFVTVNTASGNSNVVNISVFGDVVSF